MTTRTESFSSTATNTREAVTQALGNALPSFGGETPQLGIIFASNKLGFENFELFLVDVDGRKEPVRVTYSDGFDGLPVPSPDGRQLAWTSTRGGGSQGQIFLAQWNHERALAAIAAAPLRRAPQSAQRSQ